MLIAVAYKEITGSESPASVGFGPDGGRAQTPYLVLTEDLSDSVVDLLGYTEMGTTESGRLTRHLPRAHPRFPQLFCSAIADIRGFGQFTKVAAEPDLEAPAVTHGASYDQYRVQVEFTPRPYAILPDAQIVTATLDYYDDSGSLVTGVKYADEYARYCHFEYQGGVELITAQQGQMVLRVNGGADPDEFSFPGQPVIRVPNGTLIARWFQVPYRYVMSSNSNLTKWLGRVNQNDWGPYLAGELLYDSFRTTRVYPPPFPESYNPSAIRFMPDRLCDIEIVFKHAKRTAGATPPTPANGNWIAGGHNLLPWLGDRKFYYATAYNPASPATTSEWVPTYLSFRPELLFTDPDVS